MWRQANKYGVPRMCFINKMDRLGADFFAALESIKERLGANVAVIQLPIGAEGNYKGLIDLVTMEALVWHDEELGAKWDVEEIPAELKAQAEEYRHQLIDVLSSFDENILEKYVGEEEITVDDLRSAIRTRHDLRRDRADPQRHRLQEQGRAAAARRRRRLPPEPRRPARPPRA